MNRYICIHGHFYQPPRENPWLEEIEIQDSAHPYHDWNERINVECYAPNAVSRILDAQGRITGIVNNYSRISFNFGPTLLSWLEQKAPATYAALLEADGESRTRFGGHGSAIAQAYSHPILPLASRRDKETQIIWGIRDFRHRFGRDPEGMWLPETACDIESLELLAQHGIRFTILAPHQAARVRKTGDGAWQDVSGARIDPSRVYRQLLPSGREIALFFYDGPIARAVAFERLLDSGKAFADRLQGGLSGERTWAQLAHIATDGESYGHHHRFGDMALAYALNHVENLSDVHLTNYGEFLERHPPTHEVQILENTSWSCAHGIERWRGDCGCHSGAHSDWNQGWRAPLRAALDDLRDRLTAVFETASRELLKDPWAARNDYIDVVLDRSPERIAEFLGRHGVAAASSDTVRTLKLLEMQRHALLMYTSCGWFFDDLSGIETVQIIQYAARALQLAGELGAAPLEDAFVAHLAQAQSNLADQGSGETIYRRRVKPMMLELSRVGAHYAVSTLFEEYPESARIYCYQAAVHAHRRLESGAARLSLGQARMESLITREALEFAYAALHFGDHNIAGGVCGRATDSGFEPFTDRVTEAFGRMDVTQIIQLFGEQFGDETFSLSSLFRDEQRRYLGLVLAGAVANAESAFLQLYLSSAPIMKYLAGLHLPRPEAFEVAARQALHYQLRSAFEADVLDTNKIRRLLEEALEEAVELDGTTLGYTLQLRLEKLARRFAGDPRDAELLRDLYEGVLLLDRVPFAVNTWRLQNIYWDLLNERRPAVRSEAQAGNREARAWLDRFDALGGRLRVAVR